MPADEILKSLPKDSKEAFIKYESFYREKMEKGLNENRWRAEREYVFSMLAFMDAYGFEFPIHNQVPQDDEDFHEYFSFFRDQIFYEAQKIKLEMHREESSLGGDSVDLSADYRNEIHDNIKIIRRILNAISLNESRREVLFKRLNEFATEVDRTRTRLQSFKAFFLEATKVAGEGADNLEPVVAKAERIAEMLGEAKGKEEQAWLLSKDEKKLLISPGKIPEIDDDIPF